MYIIYEKMMPDNCKIFVLWIVTKAITVYEGLLFVTWISIAECKLSFKKRDN